MSAAQEALVLVDIAPRVLGPVAAGRRDLAPVGSAIGLDPSELSGGADPVPLPRDPIPLASNRIASRVVVVPGGADARAAAVGKAQAAAIVGDTEGTALEAGADAWADLALGLGWGAGPEDEGQGQGKAKELIHGRSVGLGVGRWPPARVVSRWSVSGESRANGLLSPSEPAWRRRVREDVPSGLRSVLCPRPC